MPAADKFRVWLTTWAPEKTLSLIRQADIVLGKCGGRGFRAKQIVKLGELNLVIEGVVGNPVQQGGHPPREALGFPYPRQRAVGVMIEAGVGFVGKMLDQSF